MVLRMKPRIMMEDDKLNNVNTEVNAVKMNNKDKIIQMFRKFFLTSTVVYTQLNMWLLSPIVTNLKKYCV